MPKNRAGCARGGRPSRWRVSSSPLPGRSGTGAGQADLDEGRRTDGLTTKNREEVRRLKREVKRLRMERDILKKAAAWFTKESGSIPGGGFGFVKGSGSNSRPGDAPRAGSLPQRVLTPG